MTLETMAALSDDPVVGLPAHGHLTNPAPPEIARAPFSYTTTGDTI